MSSVSDIVPSSSSIVSFVNFTCNASRLVTTFFSLVLFVFRRSIRFFPSRVSTHGFAMQRRSSYLQQGARVHTGPLDWLAWCTASCHTFKHLQWMLQRHATQSKTIRFLMILVEKGTKLLNTQICRFNSNFVVGFTSFKLNVQRLKIDPSARNPL